MNGSRRVPPQESAGRSASDVHGFRVLVSICVFLGLTGFGIVAPEAAARAVVGGRCSSSPVQVTAAPDSALDNLFQSYGDRAAGTTWSGGDGTESVALPDGRELWLFADSVLGMVTNGRRIYSQTPFVHNVLLTEVRGVLTSSLYTPGGNQPSAYVSLRSQDPVGIGFWPGASVVSDGTLQVLGLEVRVESGGSWSILGNALVTLALPSLGLLGVEALPASATDWSGGLLSDGGYTYLYGSAGKDTYAARVLGSNLSALWSYYDGDGWSSDPTTAVPIETMGTTSHFSVSKVGDGFVFITKSSWMTPEITAAFGCSPVGPFGSPRPIYATPEASLYPSPYRVVTYGALAHPELSRSPDTLVVSYDVDALGVIEQSWSDAAICRPRFIDVTLRPVSRPRVVTPEATTFTQPAWGTVDAPILRAPVPIAPDRHREGR